MPVYTFLTSAYALAIYIYGNKSFETIPEPYYPSVKQYAADKYSVSQIDSALERGFITQEVYDETMALKNTVPPSDPEPEV